MRNPWRSLAAAAATIGLLVAIIVTSGSASGAGVSERAGGVVLTSVGEFDAPVYVEAAPGRQNRKLLFVVEQEGTVRVVRNGRTLPQPFLDLGERISSGGERGLLSIAFHPDYAKNRRFYLYYTDPEGNIRVGQMRRDPKRKTVASPRSLRKVIEVPHPDASNHNGGTVAFGPDGELWLATGDGGSSCDPRGNAQSPGSLLGKLLRITPRRRGGYSIPGDNPFVGTPGRDEIYALGLRNPFRFSFDRRTRTIAIGDVGQKAFEEVNYETLRSARGANFGWDAYEGTRPVPPSSCSADQRSPFPPVHAAPIHEYGRSGQGYTGCSITGGLIVRDRRLGGLRGRYLYSDFCNGEIRALKANLSGATMEGSTGLTVESPVAFTDGRRNRVYVSALYGEVFRIDPAAPAAQASG